jgi:hypothetical protein
MYANSVPAPPGLNIYENASGLSEYTASSADVGANGGLGGRGLGGGLGGGGEVRAKATLPAQVAPDAQPAKSV